MTRSGSTEKSLFEENTHHFGRRWVFEDDNAVVADASLEGVDELISLLKKETAIPFVIEVCDVTPVYDSSVFRARSGYFDRNLIVVTMGPTTLAVVVEETMSGADACWSIGTDMDGSFSCVGDR